MRWLGLGRGEYTYSDYETCCSCNGRVTCLYQTAGHVEKQPPTYRPSKEQKDGRDGMSPDHTNERVGSLLFPKEERRDIRNATGTQDSLSPRRFPAPLFFSLRGTIKKKRQNNAPCRRPAPPSTFFLRLSSQLSSDDFNQFFNQSENPNYRGWEFASDI